MRKGVGDGVVQSAGVDATTWGVHYKHPVQPLHLESLFVCFDGVVNIYQSRLLNGRVRVEQRIRAHRAITCVEGEIRQVLSNLVSNAIESMQSSGGRLLLRSRCATNWSNGRKGLAITIADTGTGIHPDVRKKIFEPFFTTKRHSGNGLGLSVSLDIVTRHQGSLRVRSRQAPNHSGTVFSLFLPSDAAI